MQNNRFEQADIRYFSKDNPTQFTGYYYGQYIVVNNVRNAHGQGTQYNMQNQVVYKGSFLNDYWHGKGIWYYSCGGYYEGELANGKAHGFGTLFLDGSKYEGHWENGDFKKGSVYSFGQKQKGEFCKTSHSLINGTVYSKNGDVFNRTGYQEGVLYNGTVHRKGKLIYSGQFLDISYSGHGEQHFTLGKYTGGFENGEWHGKGRFDFGFFDNVYFEGEFVSGKAKSGYIFCGKKNEKEHLDLTSGSAYLNIVGGGVFLYSDMRVYLPLKASTYYLNANCEFEGQVLHDKPHGLGKLVFYDCGTTVEGNFILGLSHGELETKFYDGSVLKTNAVLGEASGVAEYILQDGTKHALKSVGDRRVGQNIILLGNNKYIGDIKHNHPNGHGTMYYNWRENKKNIRFVGTFINGEPFEGEWHGVAEGWNVARPTKRAVEEINYTGGNKYIGETIRKDGKRLRHGQGEYISAEGTKYKGEFVEDKFAGIATCQYKNGDIYVGKFKDGLRHGKGAFYWTNGGVYVGEFKDGKFTGYATEYYTSGNRFEGNFNDYKKEGKGTSYYASGNRIEGNYSGDKPVGVFTYYFANGDIKTGTFKDGKFVPDSQQQ
ncbi:MAG: hypothetical protein FWB72_06485 [Firmicutes bacterium]|nr:hypothetical protein [Bacillota bacterium]